MNRRGLAGALVAGLVSACFVAGSARAQDRLRLAIGQRGNWDTAVSELGQRAGIFAKHGLQLDILWTEGAGESQQAVISGSVDIGLAGTLSAMSAFLRGAPVRAIAAEATGSADFWYVRAETPVRTPRDMGNRTVAYSTNGASTHTLAMTMLKQAGTEAKLVATGSPSATRIQVMSGQVDVGWSAPPFGLDSEAAGQIRIVGRGADVLRGREQTIRVLITTKSVIDARADALKRYLQAYRETLAWMYTDDAAIREYAQLAQVPEATARRVRDEFFPRSFLDPDRVEGLGDLLVDAVTFKYVPPNSRAEQWHDFFLIPFT